MVYAAGEGHTAVVKLLLANGVGPNVAYNNVVEEMSADEIKNGERLAAERRKSLPSKESK